MTELNTDVVQYDITDAAIQAMEDEYSDLTIIDKESYEVVRLALGVLRGHRTAVEKWRKENNASDQTRINVRNSRCKEVTALLVKIETPLKATKKVEDDKALAIEAEKEAKEEERKSAILAKITSISDLNSPDIINMGSAEIGKIRDSLIDLEITSGDFEEFMNQAERVKANVLTVIQRAYDERLKFEEAEIKRIEEETRLTEKRIEWETKEKELAEKEAELAKKETEIKAEIDRKVREEERHQIEEQAKADAIWFAKEKANRELREAKEKAEAEAAEAARQEALKPDKEKLKEFTDELNEIVGPNLESREAKDICVRALIGIGKIEDRLRSDIENL